VRDGVYAQTRVRVSDEHIRMHLCALRRVLDCSITASMLFVRRSPARSCTPLRASAMVRLTYADLASRTAISL
jgi:hypothetical protein